mgnify:FL=1
MIETLNLLKPILADIFGVEEAEITPAVLFEELGADELDLVEVSMNVEEEFDVLIDDEDLSGIQSVSDLINYIMRHRND